MNQSRPVSRVVDLLQASGYKLLANGLEVGSVNFDFAAVLVGSNRSFDLVIVADTIENGTDSQLRRSVLALARALDMVESRRSVTLITVGPQPNEISLRELSRVCRVLAVGTPTGVSADEEVRDALAVLLPLDVPVGGVGVESPLGLVRKSLKSLDENAFGALLEAAPMGEKEVRSQLKRILTMALSAES